MQVAMVVLAGGKSSRMGEEKSDLLYHGKTFLQTQIDKGKALGISEIVISGYKGKQCLENVVKDRYENMGPLGGLETSLRAVKSPYALVLSVDVPLIPTEELNRLLQEARIHQKEITVLKHGDRIEPLIGVYKTALADKMEQELLAGRRSLYSFLQREVPWVYQTARADEWFLNVNDKIEYQRLKVTRMEKF